MMKSMVYFVFHCLKKSQDISTIFYFLLTYQGLFIYQAIKASMVLLESALSLFRPFTRTTGNTLAIQVRNNCPWHRSNFRPCYFPFRLNKRLKNHNIDRRLETEGGRHILLRKVLGESEYITWNWPSKKPDKQRISYPL